MASKKPIPVRLSGDLVDRLDAVASRLGNTRASLIRFLTETFITELERNPKMPYPPEWEQILASLDGRTKEAKSNIGSPYLMTDANSSALSQAKENANVALKKALHPDPKSKLSQKAAAPISYKPKPKPGTGQKSKKSPESPDQAQE